MTSLKFRRRLAAVFTAGTNIALTRRFVVEQVTRIELAWPAWKVPVSVCTREAAGREVFARGMP
jgi:hypothetical protein